MTKRDDRRRLHDVFKRMLWEADEKKVRLIIARDLGQPEGTPEHDYFLKR